MQRVRELAAGQPDHHIAEQLNAEGLRTQTSKTWTAQRVQNLRKSHHIVTGCKVTPAEPGPRGDGLISAASAARALEVSDSLIHLWAKQGVLTYDQRVFASYLWVRLTDADRRRLDGSADSTAFPTFAEVMARTGLSRDELWEQVRTNHYVAYRARRGQAWEYRLQPVDNRPYDNDPSVVGPNEGGTTRYG